jgi:hypothetical protein
MAARKGHSECVKLLLEAGAQVNFIPSVETSPYSHTALTDAARHTFNRDNTEVVRVLLEAGADPNLGGPQSRFPLHEAVRSKYPKMVELLLAAGARIDILNEEGRLPLHCALGTEEDRSENVRLLLAHGADVNRPDSKGEPPLFYVLNGYDSVPVLRTLLEFKPDLTVKKSGAELLPLDYAEEHDLREHAALLKAAGAPQTPEPPPPPPRTETVYIDDPKTGGKKAVKITVRVVSVSRSEETAVEPADVDDAIRISKRVRADASSSWEASPGHWNILRGLARLDLPLDRCAYFARGFLNAPKGEELDDWAKVLGEPYADALGRFVALGIVTVVGAREAIESTATVDRIKSAVKALGLQRVGTTKAQLIAALLGSVREQDLAAYIEYPTLFRITEFGKIVLSQREERSRALLAVIGTELLAQVAASDPETAMMCVLKLLRLSNGGRCQKDLGAAEVTKFREAWKAVIPPSIFGTEVEPALAKTWLIAVVMDIVSTNTWSLDLGIPKLPFELMPWEFMQRVLAPEDLDGDDEEED